MLPSNELGVEVDGNKDVDSLGGAASNTLISSEVGLVDSENGVRDRASAATLSLPLIYFKVTPYSSKASRYWSTRSDVNFVDRI